MLLTPGHNFIELFTAVIYDVHNKLECLRPGRPFQLNLMFVGKAAAYLNGALSGAPL